MGLKPRNKRILIIGAILVLALGAIGIYVSSIWGSVNRVEIERPTADVPNPVVAQPNEPDPGEPADIPEVIVDDSLQVFLLVGSDSRADLASTDGFGDFEGNRADVVMVLFKEGSDAGLLSIPRDLLVNDVCTGSEQKISIALEGCEGMNGPSVLTVTVERLIGRQVDHFAMVDLAGFQEAVDAAGGYEICVDYPVRDSRANLELDAGCTQATGAQTLAWLRSRHTQELTPNGWRTVPGINDLVRNERQRTFLVEMMGRLSDLSSPQAMASMASSLAPYVTVDSELSLSDAVRMASTMQGLDSGSVVQLDVPVYDYTTDSGAAALLPSTPVDQIVSEYLAAFAEGGDVAVGLTE